MNYQYDQSPEYLQDVASLKAATVGESAFSYANSAAVITRDANTTAYTANAIVNSVGAVALPKSSFGADNASKNVKINRLRITSNQAPATSIIQPALWMFPAGTFGSQGIADGTVCNAITSAESITSQGKLQYSEFDAVYSWLNTGSGYEYVISDLDIIANLDSAGDLYWMLLATNAYTPKSGEILTIGIQGYIL